jgi:transposase-like protein
MLCPRCGEITHRSHTRGFSEKLIKALTSHRTYRCHECGWRGWLRSGDPAKRRYRLLTIASVLITLLLTTLLALYVVDKLSPPVPDAHFEPQRSP